MLPKGDFLVDYDVVVVGAGISGINSAYHLQNQASSRGLSYVILEGRESIGGTWDLFRYPGVRSDSDVHSFGFSWEPWTKPHAIATAAEILEYLQTATKKYGIDRNIKLNHSVLSADWSSKTSSWTVQVSTGDQGRRSIRTRFIVLGTGYYDYENALQPVIPNLDKFQKAVVWPQFWPGDVDYVDKNIVVIGSGATAITLLPNLAKKARHITMLQRTPSYVVPLPRELTGFRTYLRAVLPARTFSWLLRLQFILATAMLYHFCITFPNAARRVLEKRTKEQLPRNETLEPNFKPPYTPWQQRLCISPDGDFYVALRSGKADVLTDTIQDVSESGIHLTSGASLKPDLIVVATGLKVRFAGDIKISVDSRPVDVSQKYAYRGCLIQDVPNLAYVFGYAHAAWTLGADVTATLVGRVLAQMSRKGAHAVVPVVQSAAPMPAQPMLPLTSTYLKHAGDVFPKGGIGQWKPRWNYFFDYWEARWADLDSGLVFT